MDSDCSKQDVAAKASARPGPLPRRTDGGAPMYDLIELMFFAYRDFVGDADHLLATLGLWPGAPPGLAFCVPAAGPHNRRIAGYSENHQAKSQSRPQGTARSGLCRGPPGHEGSPPAPIVSDAARRSARVRCRGVAVAAVRQRCSPNCRKGRAPQAIAFPPGDGRCGGARQGCRDDRCRPGRPVLPRPER